jgi:hypothetical protein
VIDDAVSFVDVVERAIAQASSPGIVFFARDVVVRFVEKFKRLVIAAAMSEVRINRHMVMNILAVIDGGVLDFGDGSVDLIDGMLLFVVAAIGVSEMLEVSAGVAQIAERMQVRRMTPRIVGKAES